MRGCGVLPCAICRALDLSVFMLTFMNNVHAKIYDIFLSALSPFSFRFFLSCFFRNCVELHSIATHATPQRSHRSHSAADFVSEWRKLNDFLWLLLLLRSLLRWLAAGIYFISFRMAFGPLHDLCVRLWAHRRGESNEIISYANINDEEICILRILLALRDSKLVHVSPSLHLHSHSRFGANFISNLFFRHFFSALRLFPITNSINNLEPNEDGAERVMNKWNAKTECLTIVRSVSFRPNRGKKKRSGAAIASKKNRGGGRSRG